MRTMIVESLMPIFGTLFGMTTAYGTYIFIHRLIYNYKLKPQPKNEIVFFNGENARCRKHCLETKNKPCGPECSLVKLNHIISEIDNAQKTLDVCMYLITCNDLTHAIIRAQQRNVVVRVIVDEDMATSSESKIRWLGEAGIQVRSKSSSVLMHHKFCIVDYDSDNRKLITGSLNWTLQGLAGNYEYVSIIKHPRPVQAYEDEFNKMWNTFTPYNYE